MFAGVSPCWAGAAASRGFPAAGTRSASRSASRVARATSWRRDATFGARALASFDGAGRDTPGDRVLGAPRRRIANRALSVPEGATEEEEGDDRGYASGGPKILRFNGDKISLHQSPANGSTNARRAAAAGASSLTPRIFQILLGNARAVPNPSGLARRRIFFSDPKSEFARLAADVVFSLRSVLPRRKHTSRAGFDFDAASVSEDDGDGVTARHTNDSSSVGERASNLTGLIDEVAVVETEAEARRVLAILMDNVGDADRPVYHAVDTEVAHIEIADQTPVGHGHVTCFSVYCGPDVDFSAAPGVGKPKTLLWVDTLRLGEAGWEIFRPYFESDDVKKAWHNYSFDRHVIENHGVKLRGFAADTMHMARLWNSNRKLEGGYSLEALSSDPKVMSDAGEMFSDAGEDLIRQKRSIKKIFGKPKLKKDGTPGKTMILPPVEEIQEDEEQRQTWIEYSALDAQATWFLRESLEAKLRGIDCEACPVLSAKPSFRKSNNLWEFYTHYLREFAEVLTDMESAGMFVDKEHLARAETQALADKKKAEEYFRAWAVSKCPAAEHMNVGSGIQVRQLLFAGAAHKKRDKPGVEKKKAFAMVSPEWIAWDAGGREGKAPKKAATFELYGITKRNLQPPAYTTTGLPAVSGVVLRQLAGKPGEARAVVDEWDALPDSEKTEEALRKRCGGAFLAFGGGKEGAEACAAIDALNDVAAIDTLLSNFIIPLQSDNLRGGNGRVHAALNINTETGRLSARRPSLQNQPALEKDRYGIRKAFTCKPGNVLVVADYGQLELRLLAHMAGCVSMREAFEAGGDFHSRTAMGMYQEIKDAMTRGEVLLEYGSEVHDEDPTKPKPSLVKDAFASERRKAKVLNFSIAYGKTAHGLAKDFGVSTKEAEETVQLWYSDRPEVRAWQEVQHRKAAEKGKVSTLLGRHRNLPEASSSDEARRQHALRASINTPIQGGAADIAMLAMLQIHRCPRLRELGFRMLMQIHDEVILEGPEEHKDEALALVKLHMEKPFNDHENLCDVDLNVDGDYASTWFDAK
jgi:DNA polymerase-1